MPKFKSNVDGPITVYVPGHSSYDFDGNTVDTDDAAVIAAFKANPDVSEVKASKKK